MIQSSAAYQAAITGDTRRILFQALVSIIDPDITFGVVTSSGESPFSQPAQLHDKNMDPGPTLRHAGAQPVVARPGTYQILP